METDLSLHTVKEEEEEEEEFYSPISTPRPRPTQILQRPSSGTVLSGTTNRPGSGRLLTRPAETPEFRPSRPALHIEIPSPVPNQFTGPRPQSPMPTSQEIPQQPSGTAPTAGSRGGTPPWQLGSFSEPAPASVPQPTTAPVERLSPQQSPDVTSVAEPRGKTPPRHPRAFQASHSNSKTWVHERIVARERWKEVERNLSRMRFSDKSEVVPGTFNQYMLFRRDRAAGNHKREARKLAQRNPPNVWPLSGLAPVKVGPAFSGKHFNDGRSAVLAQPTMWSQEYVPSEEKPQAPWPTIEEMREEGDERATSRFGRFPGVPRMPGNETAAWRTRIQLQQYPMDDVRTRPCKETYEAARRQSTLEEMAEMEALLGKDFVDALDCKTFDDF